MGTLNKKTDDDEFEFEPVAAEVMGSGDFDAKRFKAAHGKGETDEETAFALRFAYSLAKRAVSALEAGGEAELGGADFNRVVGRWGVGSFHLGEEPYGFAARCFMEEMARAFPAWTRQAGWGPELTINAKKAIVKAVGDQPGCVGEARSMLIDALLGAGSFGPAESGENKRKEMLARAKAGFLRAKLSSHVEPASAQSPAVRL